ncbi:hypothetical protein A3842_11060 [Paenibacillus sp. P3E]|uniref:hypothetical protein n=1 Tax=Paenibacillus sp. P3E TaxID=1349435 RepID=UPI00093A002A|nr:hypothetical protein [Paenibacillus sp. P3E]OKP81612.1 hypothetical protein A3842_11060 [Paenibacillus sp. P3E]
MTDLIQEVKEALQAAQRYLEHSEKQKVYDESVHIIAALKKHLETAERQREEAVKALEWYGGGNHFKTNQLQSKILEVETGELARTTLKRIKGENG